MIIRVFRARVREGNIDEFKQKVEQLSIPLVRSANGLVTYYSGRPLTPDSREFVMITIWRDLESVKAFAGENWQHAVIPEQEIPLLEETFVQHYETL